VLPKYSRVCVIHPDFFSCSWLSLLQLIHTFFAAFKICSERGAKISGFASPLLSEGRAYHLALRPQEDDISWLSPHLAFFHVPFPVTVEGSPPPFFFTVTVDTENYKGINPL